MVDVVLMADGRFTDIAASENKDDSGRRSGGFRLWIRVIALVLVLTLVGDMVLRSAAFGTVTVSFKTGGDKVTVDGSGVSDSLKRLKKTVFVRYGLKDAYELFSAAVEAENWAEALAPAEDLYAYLRDNKSAGAYLRQVLAQLYYMNGYYEKCARTCESIVLGKEDPAGSYSFMQGVALMQTGDWADAEDALEKAMDSGMAEKTSEGTVCRLQILSCRYNQKKYKETAEYGLSIMSDDDAGKEAGSSLLSDAERISVETLTAVSLLQTEEYKACENLLSVLIEKTQNSEFYYYRGISRMSLKDYSGGVSDLQKAISLGLEDADYQKSARDILDAITGYN